MAGPLSGVAGQQVPASQPQQNSQNANHVREQEVREPEENRVQPQGAPPAEAQNTETNNQDALQQQLDEIIAVQQSGELNSADQPRGSVIDITV